MVLEVSVAPLHSIHDKVTNFFMDQMESNLSTWWWVDSYHYPKVHGRIVSYLQKKPQTLH